MIRRLTWEDREWAQELCRLGYPQDYFNPEASENWLRPLLDHSSVLALRSDKAIWITALTRYPFNPALRYAMTFAIVSVGENPFTLVKMARQSVEWAKAQGAVDYIFETMTGVDLGPIARRLGAKPASPAYKLEF